MKQFPEICSHCSKDSSFVHDKTFENGIRKILEGKENLLTATEKQSVTALEIEQKKETEAGTSNDFAESLLKKRKIEKTGLKSCYMNCKFLVPTSNIIERFFSSATFSYNHLRRKIMPLNLEMQLFLKMNKRFWDSNLVSEVL